MAGVGDACSRTTVRVSTSFAALRGDVDVTPADSNWTDAEGARDILDLSDVRRFLYLIDPGGFPDRRTYLAEIGETAYDLLILDAFDNDGDRLARGEVTTLKAKPSGGRRLVLGYLSIGEAEDYRPYWDPSWSTDPPPWLGRENPNWPGNYEVFYENPAWRRLIEQEIAAIVDAGFDGVYLDRIDAYEARARGS